ncbi:hypothetical protein ACIBCD_42965 [Nocardia brasiliensis]|uniref:hypothetical protein n=1 Tax=Nocardia brasiliensis TaxID=37326 RepID=UPI0037B04C37
MTEREPNTVNINIFGATVSDESSKVIAQRGSESGDQPAVQSAGVGGALLIEADFGAFSNLRQVASTQHKVRTLLLTLVDYEVSRLSEWRPEPDEGAVAQLIPIIDEAAEEESELGDMVREVMQLSHPSENVAFLVAGLAARVPMRTDTLLSVSSSVTVNPWQEVVQAAVQPALWATGGTAAAGAVLGAVRTAFRHMPQIITNIVELTSIRSMREVRLAELEAEATRLQNETLLDILHTANEVAVAAKVRDAILAMSLEDVLRLDIRPITDQEADDRRRRVLRLVRADEDPQE